MGCMVVCSVHYCVYVNVCVQYCLYGRLLCAILCMVVCRVQFCVYGRLFCAILCVWSFVVCNIVCIVVCCVQYCVYCRVKQQTTTRIMLHCFSIRVYPSTSSPSYVLFHPNFQILRIPVDPLVRPILDSGLENNVITILEFIFSELSRIFIPSSIIIKSLLG